MHRQCGRKVAATCSEGGREMLLKPAVREEGGGCYPIVKACEVCQSRPFAPSAPSSDMPHPRGSPARSRRRAGRDARRDRGGCALLRPPLWRPGGSALRRAHAAKRHHALGGGTRRGPTRSRGHYLAELACPRRQDDLRDEPVSAGGGRRVGHGRGIVPGALNGPLRASRRAGFAVVGHGEVKRNKEA